MQQWSPRQLQAIFSHQKSKFTFLRSVTEELNTTEKELLNSVKYSDLFGGEEEQLQVARAYQIILTTRERLLTNRQRQGLPGPHNSGPD